jgi:hypothetical protein
MYYVEQKDVLQLVDKVFQNAPNNEINQIKDKFRKIAEVKSK